MAFTKSDKWHLSVLANAIRIPQSFRKRKKENWEHAKILEAVPRNDPFETTEHAEARLRGTQKMM